MNSACKDITIFLKEDSTLCNLFSVPASPDIYYSEDPDLPRQHLTVFDSGGFPLDLSMYYERPTVQIKITALSYDQAYSIAEQVKIVLCGIQNREESDETARYIAIWPMGDVLSLGKNDKGLHMITANYRIHRTPTTY